MATLFFTAVAEIHYFEIMCMLGGRVKKEHTGTLFTEVLHPLKLELQMVMSCSMWVPGPKLRTTTRPGCTLSKYRAISPAPYFKCYLASYMSRAPISLNPVPVI